MKVDERGRTAGDGGDSGDSGDGGTDALIWGSSVELGESALGQISASPNQKSRSCHRQACASPRARPWYLQAVCEFPPKNPAHRQPPPQPRQTASTFPIRESAALGRARSPWRRFPPARLPARPHGFTHMHDFAFVSGLAPPSLTPRPWPPRP